MAMIVPNTGENKLLTLMMTGENFVLHLYAVSMTLSETTTISDFSGKEVASAGYSPITLDKTKWTVSSGMATYNEACTFTFTAGNNVYGYYVTNSDSTILLWAEQYSQFLKIPAGGTISITPKMTMD